MRLFYFTCSAVFYPQSDVRWGNIMCYHGGDQQTQRGCKKNTMAAWGWGLPAQLLGEGQKITPSGYQLPKRGSASTITIRSKKWGHKSSRPEKMSHLLLVVSEPSSWGPQSGRVSCPPRTYIHSHHHLHAPLFIFIFQVSSVPTTNEFIYQKIPGPLITCTCTNCLCNTIFYPKRSYLPSSSTQILSNPRVTPHLCLHDKNEQSCGNKHLHWYKVITVSEA